MAKPQAPLFGFGASGQLGKALVYGQWKGIPVARQYVVPSNPNTPAQSTQRGYMTAAVDSWHDPTLIMEPDDKSAWNRFAGTLKSAMSGFNAFCRSFIDEGVLGGSWFAMQEETTIATTANLFSASVQEAGGATDNVTLHMGSTKTFFAVTEVQAAVANVATFAPFDTGFAPGTTVYFWFEVGTPGGGYGRTGLYTALLS